MDGTEKTLLKDSLEVVPITTARKQSHPVVGNGIKDGMWGRPIKEFLPRNSKTDRKGEIPSGLCKNGHSRGGARGIATVRG
jgi:hypothetical protein